MKKPSWAVWNGFYGSIWALTLGWNWKIKQGLWWEEKVPGHEYIIPFIIHEREMLCALLALCGMNTAVIGGFPSQRASKTSSCVFFLYDSLNKRLNKELICQWLETSWHSWDVTGMLLIAIYIGILLLTCLTLIPTLLGTVETLYNTINFCWSTHKRHSIARPKGRGMGCLLWVQRSTYSVDLSILSSIKYLL